ncbi:hypothetical protein ACFX58_13725 [Sphingomonas sp. NCPPB 2930]
MRRLLIAIFFVVSPVCMATAGTFENWSASSVDVGGTYYSDGPSSPPTAQTKANPVNDEQITVWNGAARWLSNNWKADCKSNPSGPNPCYAPSNGQLFFHAEAGGNAGGGFLLVSQQKFSFANGISVEVPISAFCTEYSTAHAVGCGVNVGLYRGEQNYRSFGYSNTSGSVPLYANIWGPTLEAHFDGGAPLYNNIPIEGNAYKTVKVQY